MKQEHWQQIKLVVDTVLTLPVSERKHYINQHFKDEPDTQQEITELLQAMEESEENRFLDDLYDARQKIADDISEKVGSSFHQQKLIGEQIGPYSITEILGNGGMGSVFKGERTDGRFSQQVAIKLIKKGVETEENIRRFQMEQEILSRLHHPNISQLYDGGLTDDGIPYLIMEFIDGVPVDEYCNNNRLTIDERIEIFKKICDGVQYAHNNLVIHRDLKTQNIYVTKDGVIKILDFGVAKFMNNTVTEMTLLETQPYQKLWTPYYASPEQVLGEPVTVETDIYALGVLFHRLLTDSWPLDLKGKNHKEFEHVIANIPPTPASQSLKEGSRRKVASHRKSTPSELRKKLSGDLDALILKAIRKEPKYRYNSVSQLLEDIYRYQKKLPLLARKYTTSYRLGKYYRRHKMGLAIAVSFLILIVSLTSVYSYRINAEREEAQTEAAKAKQVTDFMMQLFNANDPNYAPGKEITAEDLLQSGAQKIDEMHDQPELQAEMLSTIGNLYKKMGLYDQSQRFLEQALDLQVKLYGINHPSVTSNIGDLGLLFLEAGNLEKASDLIYEAYNRDQAMKQIPDAATATRLNNLGLISMRLGAYDESKKHYRKALEILSDLKSEDSQSTIAILLNNLGFVYEHTGDLDEARTYYEESLKVKETLYGEEHASVAVTLNNLGRFYQKTNKPDSALYYHRKTFLLREKLFDADHPLIAQSVSNIGMVLAREGKYDEAEQYYTRALNIYKRTLGETHSSVGLIYGKLGDLYMKNGKDLAVAQTYLEDSAEIYRQAFGADHPDLYWSHKRLADCYRLETKFDKAAEELQKALEIHQKYFPDKKEEYADLQKQLLELENEIPKEHFAEEFR